MQDRSSSPPLTNMITFAVLFFALLMGYQFLMRQFFPPPPQAANAPAAQEKEKEKADKAKKEGEKDKAGEKAEAGKKGEAAKKPEASAQAGPKVEPKPAEAPGEAPKPAVPAAKQEPRQWITLGSAAPDTKEEPNPYRMLVTLGNAGASVARIELSSARYRDLEDRSGYLGHLVMEDDHRGKGCVVQVVGEGTPAAKAGVRPGDRILKLNDHEVADVEGLEEFLNRTKPDQSVELTIERDGKPLPSPVPVTLTRHPLEVVRPERSNPQIFPTKGPYYDAVLDPTEPERNSPLSLLCTLQQIDGEKLRPSEDAKAPLFEQLNMELKGVELRQATWTVVGTPDREHVAFRRSLSAYDLEITKTYRLVKAADDQVADPDARAYHLELSIEVKNTGKVKHEVAYRLDGPTGLPREGFWYAYSSKVGIKGDAGLRDVVFQLAKTEVNMVSCGELNDKLQADLTESSQFAGDHLPRFFGVDAQYFAAALLPDQGKTETAQNIDRAVAIRVGHVDEQLKKLTNTSFRILSKPATLKPGESLTNNYEFFAGPKRKTTLEPYQLGGLIYYGWPIFSMVARPLTQVLDFFYRIVGNFGLAIIMLTVVVRLAMFPMSRKQAQNAQVMQKLQPEMKRLQEKYKKDVEGRTRAQQELFAKHNYSPFGGCLLLLIQMPVFLGLYRALQVNIELRDAPLFSHAVRWCSNLAAPDMFYDWSWFMPHGVNIGTGVGLPIIGGLFGLGPYFNIFPMITLGLFLAQQKVMMPPPADEQAATQMKVMNYVMILMGFLFFKVAAGLCIYFIASTLWGLTERKFLPKTAKAGGGDSGDDSGGITRTAVAEEAAERRKKRKKK